MRSKAFNLIRSYSFERLELKSFIGWADEGVASDSEGSLSEEVSISSFNFKFDFKFQFWGSNSDF